MASPATEEAPDKPLRQRLFSLSRKKQKDDQTQQEKPAETAGHAAENSGSTSKTLAVEAPTSAGDQGPVPSSTPAEPPSASLAAGTDDKEQGSLNTTLTGNNKRTMFYHRKGNKSSTSQAAVSSSTTSHSIVKPAPQRARSKNTFLTRVVYKLVPCVGPDSNVVVDMDVSGPQMTERRPSEAGPQTGNPDASAASTSAALLVPPTINIERPPSRAESEVIVPPPPSTHLLPEEETDGLTSGAVQPPGSTGDLIIRTHTRDSEESEGTSFTDDEGDDRALDEQAREELLIRNGGSGIPIGPDGLPRPLLPPIAPEHVGRKCLVLDLDETLVHSSFKPIPQPDFIVPVEIEFHWHHFHVLKRPGVDEFLKKMGELYEIVVFTASLSKYADPVLDKLDTHQVVAHRLFREHCFNHKGNYVKDLSQLGRSLSETIILDNSPASFLFNVTNSSPVSSWFNDPHDVELTDMIPFLTDLATVDDVRGILDLAI